VFENFKNMGKFGGNNSGIDLYEKNIVRLKTR
jgi:hypothetical protein